MPDTLDIWNDRSALGRVLCYAGGGDEEEVDMDWFQKAVDVGIRVAGLVVALVGIVLRHRTRRKTADE